MSNFQQNLFISFHGILLLVINILTVRNSMPIISTSLQVDEAMWPVVNKTIWTEVISANSGPKNLTSEHAS